jgi:PAS domain S-box-containing protein
MTWKAAPTVSDDTISVDNKEARMTDRGPMPRAENILAAASESILVTTADLDAPGPTIVYVNPAFERMTGWPANEIVGRSPRILQGPETDLSIFSGMREAIQGGERWEGMTINYRKDGSTFFMEWSITPLVGEAGQPSHYVAVQRDVSARVEAERQISKAREQAQLSERRKSNLARYVSPRMAEMLADRDAPLGRVRKQQVAILIVDIIGFTKIAESMPPERVIALLRSFYRRLASIIFRHEGSIEHFAGDSLMAVFGIPESTGKDASGALLSALEITNELGRWNAKRQSAGRQRIDAAISAHCGPAVLGDIGTRESMSFTVIGDTVNTASRIQELCRAMNEPVLVSEAIIEQMELDEDLNHPSSLSFKHAGTHHLRGRAQPIAVLAPAGA